MAKRRININKLSKKKFKNSFKQNDLFNETLSKKLRKPNLKNNSNNLTITELEGLEDRRYEVTSKTVEYYGYSHKY